jgi:hypothetical protein
VAPVLQKIEKIYVGQKSQGQAQPIGQALQAEMLSQKFGGQEGDKQAEEKGEEVPHEAMASILPG